MSADYFFKKPIAVDDFRQQLIQAGAECDEIRNDLSTRKTFKITVEGANAVYAFINDTGEVDSLVRYGSSYPVRLKEILKNLKYDIDVVEDL